MGNNKKMKTLVNFLFESQYNFKIDKSEKAKITDYKNQLSENAYRLFYTAERHDTLWDTTVYPLIKQMVKRVNKGEVMDINYLATSSTMSKICTECNKSVKKYFDLTRPISKSDKNEFKYFYAQYLIEYILPKHYN